MNKAFLAAMLALASTQAQAQSGQSVTQPAPNMATPQTQMNDNQQPANARRAGDGQAQGQQLTQPIPSQNQPQAQTNSNQQPGNARQTQSPAR